jgi:phosphocarrier protein HPr
LRASSGEANPVATISRTVIIGSRVGLHARPASIFVQAVNATGHKVAVTKQNGESADATSILSVLALGAEHGESVEIEVDGDNADSVANELAALLASDMDAR